MKRGFLDDDGNKFQAYVLRGFEKERLAGARMVVAVGEEGDTNSTRTRGIKQTLF